MQKEIEFQCSSISGPQIALRSNALKRLGAEMKTTKRSIVGSLATMVVGGLIPFTGASADFTPVINEFWIIKNSTEIFRDSFTDGTVPPSGPDGATTYAVSGAAGMTGEAGGTLTMTPSLGDPTVISGGQADVATFGTRLLSTNSLNSNFLGIGSSFEIHALYDMSNLPTITGDSFQLRATDRATGLNNEGDNTYALLVGVSSATGDVVVALRLQNFAADVSTLIDANSIEALLPTADEIELFFTKAAGSDDLIASYVVYDANDNILGQGVLGANTELDIYNGEDYIRAQFGSTTRISIPEPATLALLAFGLAGLGFTLRRRS